MAGDDEVEAVEANDESVEAEDSEEVEGFGLNIGSIGTVFRPVVKRVVTAVPRRRTVRVRPPANRAQTSIPTPSTSDDLSRCWRGRSVALARQLAIGEIST